MKVDSFPVRLLKLWLNPRVSRQKKILFPLLIAAYWILPDMVPFVPFDDIMFAALMVWMFAQSAAKDAGEDFFKSDGGYIDAQGEVMDEGED